MRRALSVVATTMVAVGAVAGPSAGATPSALPICQEGDGYIPGETCEVAVAVTVECPEGSAVVEYAVAGGAVGGSTVDLTWTGIAGGDVVLTGQPLTGSLAWPAGITDGAVLVFDTMPPVSAPLSYPCEEDGVGAGPGGGNGGNGPGTGTGGNGPGTDNGVGAGTDNGTTNGGTTTTTDRGVAAGNDTSSRSTVRAAAADRSGVLAVTGAEALPLVLGGGALVVGGAAALLLARRHRGAGAAE